MININSKKISFLSLIIISLSFTIPLFAQTYNAQLDNEVTKVRYEGIENNAKVFKYFLHGYIDNSNPADTTVLFNSIMYLTKRNALITRIYLENPVEPDIAHLCERYGIRIWNRSLSPGKSIIMIRISDDQNIQEFYESGWDKEIIRLIEYSPVVEQS